MKKSYHSIDLAKLFFSIVVIVFHTYPFYETHPDIGFISSNVIGRMAIPFFFVASGYFLYIGYSKDENYLKKYLKRMFQLYILWSIICLPAGIHLASSYITISHPAMWIAILLIGIFYSGTYFHLWYMVALIFSSFICIQWIKRFSLKSLLIFSSFLLCFAFTEAYYHLFEGTVFFPILKSYFELFFTARNGLFYGLFFVALGIFIAKHQTFTKIKYPFIKFVLVFILYFIETQIVRENQWAIDYNVYILSAPLIFYFFNWLLITSCPLQLNYTAIRQYSTIIYFSHGMFLEYIPWYLPIEFQYLYDIGWFRFTSVFALTIITSIIIKKHFKKLY